MKIAIIGGSGFVGTNLLFEFSDLSNVKNLDKRNSSFFPDITTLCDIRNLENLQKELVDQHLVVLLAAEHRDDVTPKSLYYDVNVQGTKNVLTAMERNNVKTLIFTSTVAIYGLNKNCPTEEAIADPFNDYGKSKYQAEELCREWVSKDRLNRSLTIIRPTVIFGENNRGNVYHLLKQIASGRFIMVGSGNNYKSLAYVKNVSYFIKFNIDNTKPEYRLFNYVDRPDLTTNIIVNIVEKTLNKTIPSFHIPKFFGMLVGYFFDLISLITKNKFSISSVRIKKFCATTKFDGKKAMLIGFNPKFSIEIGLLNTINYEFNKQQYDNKI